MTFQPNNKEIVQFLDSITHPRFTKKQLEAKLTKFFKVEIELQFEYREEGDELDDAFIFTIEGFYDVTIYFIKDKLGLYYITENNFDSNF